jgi:uncharacterized protein YggU (UPF0235/DUF167 family)
MTDVRVRVTPGAREDAIVGWQGDVLRIRVRARPERGKASEAVCRLLAEAAGVPRHSVAIVAGTGSRNKIVHVDRLDAEEVRRRIGGPIA